MKTLFRPGPLCEGDRRATVKKGLKGTGKRVMWTDADADACWRTDPGSAAQLYSDALMKSIVAAS